MKEISQDVGKLYKSQNVILGQILDLLIDFHVCTEHGQIICTSAQNLNRNRTTKIRR